jgi:hypothetical protein
MVGALVMAAAISHGVLLRSEVDKFIHSIERSNYGGALSTECSVSLSTEALRWLFGVAAV